MSLRDWLYFTQINITDLARLLGISRCYLHKIMSGFCVPSDGLTERIYEITMGKVATKEDIKAKVKRNFGDDDIS